MSRLIISLVLAVAAAFTGGREPAAVQPLDSPAPAGSFAPQLSRTRDGSVLLSWLEPSASKQHRFRAARFRNGAWAAPITIAEDAQLVANWADVPSVSEQGGTLFAHWLEAAPGSGGHAYNLKVRASTDGGLTWGPGTIAHSDRSQSEHGFAAFFRRPDGKPAIVWLDGRETQNSSHAAHGGGAGPMTLRTAAVDRRGASGELLLDGRVCDCCPTAAISTANAAIVAYRDRSPQEIRDISVVRYAGGRWSKPVTMNDGWKIGGCPVNGPALAASGKRVALAWFTGANDKPAVKVARSNDEGRTWSAPMLLSAGIPLGRVAVAIVADGSTEVAWLDHNDGNGRLVMRRVAANGAIGPLETLAPMKTDRSSGYPRMLADGAGVLYAWTDVAQDKTPRVRIARRN